MIFEKFLKAYKFFIILSFCFFVIGNQACVSAQENSGYNPPVMFEDLTPPMVRPDTKTGNIIEPKKSVRPDIVRPPVMQKPIIEPPLKKVDAPKESAIKGPKTMPALPAVSVDRQITFNGDEDNGPTIFERQQKSLKAKQNENPPSEVKEKEIEAFVPRPKDTKNPSIFDDSNQSALKKVIPFEKGQIALSSDTTNSLAAGVVKELDDEDKKEWRVQIKSFATPYGTGISSDKRVALSRALSLRSSLIAQGVSANKIDVLAEGLGSENGKSEDKIDLYLYAPPSK